MFSNDALLNYFRGCILVHYQVILILQYDLIFYFHIKRNCLCNKDYGFHIFYEKQTCDFSLINLRSKQYKNQCCEGVKPPKTDQKISVNF